jgi:membrane associated rhomboid family serine protease
MQQIMPQQHQQQTQQHQFLMQQRWQQQLQQQQQMQQLQQMIAVMHQSPTQESLGKQLTVQQMAKQGTPAEAPAQATQMMGVVPGKIEDGDDDEVEKLSNITQLIKAFNTKNMKIASQMFLDGASLRPGVSGICFAQLLILCCLIGGGVLPDMDSKIAISTPRDLWLLIDCGIAEVARVKVGEAYRLVSCLLVHGGVLHLTAVLGLQIWFGEQLEFVLGCKNFIILWVVSGVAGVMMGLAWEPTVPVLGACSACAGLMGATISFTLIHWHDWVKPYKHIAQIMALAVVDLGVGLFPEGRVLTGPNLGHSVSAIIGLGLGFAFHPTFEKHHSGMVKLGKAAAFGFTGLFYLVMGIFVFFVIEVPS